MSVQPLIKENQYDERLILSGAIDICDVAQLTAIREALLNASETDEALFAAQIQQFMLACGVPALAPNTVQATTVKSFINGVPIYSIANTTLAEFDAIYENALASAKLWSAMPLRARQAFFRIMSEEVGPKYKTAIDLAITLEVGKAGSEFEKTIKWDEWAASPQVGRYLSGTFVKDDLGRKYYLNQIQYIPDNAKHVYFYQSARAVGRGVCGSTNGFNYPAALAAPDIVASRVGGNGFIGKVPAKSPSFLYIRRKAEHEALDLMAERFSSYHWAAQCLRYGVDLADPETLRILKEGFGIIAGRQVIEPWAKQCSTLRIVGGKQAGDAFRAYRKEVDPELERTILELAGNNPVIIMPSAANIKGGIAGIISDLAKNNKNNSGQRCTSPRRWLVHKDIYAEVKKLAIEAYELSSDNQDRAIDNPLALSTKVGAIDKGGFDAAMDYLARVKEAGAKVIGGVRIYQERFPNAYYMTPALVIWEGVDEQKKQLMHAEEIFAPIANLDMVNDLNEAIAKTNRSNEHLSGGFYCDDSHIHELCMFIRGTHLGSLLHNAAPKDLSPDGVHAGRDEGGVGITGSLKSLDQYTQRKPNNSVRLLARVDSIPAATRLAEQLLAEQQ